MQRQFRVNNRFLEERMKSYIGKRVIQLIPILIGITLLSFLLMHTSSIDAIDMLEANTGSVMSEAAKQAAREELGLDKTIIQQYFMWLGNVLRGDMGVSYVSGEPVFQTFVQKLPATLYLTIISVVLTVLVSIPLGILAAVKQDRPVDYLIRFLSFFGNSMPNFFVSLLLIYFFSIKLQILPVMTNQAGWKGIIMPALTLSFSMISKYTRQIRATVLEELNKEYVCGARARGVKERVILIRSVLKVSMLTIITLLALSVGSLLGGTAIVESIFMWDGVGKMAVDAITMRDYPVIQAYVIWMAVIYVFINLLTDLIYHVLDPRIRLREEKI